MTLQDKDNKIVEDIKDELALLRRDLIDRLRRIEDYVQFVESDVGRLRRDLERIDDRIRNLSIDKISPPLSSPSSVHEVKTEPRISRTEIESIQQVSPKSSSMPQQLPVIQPSQSKVIDKREGLNQTEVAIIRFLIDNPGTKSATPIAQTVGKAREHIARTLKKLADEKKIIRDETTWPYTYVVPEEIKLLVLSQSSGSQNTITPQ